jgi:hypothetical protein
MLPKYKKISGTTSKSFQIGGPVGPILDSNDGILEIKNHDDTNIAVIRTANIHENSASTTLNDASNLLMLQARIADISFSFHGDDPPPINDNMNCFGFCHTSGEYYSAADIIYDTGSELILIPKTVVTAFTSRININGDIALRPGSLYVNQSNVVTLKSEVNNADEGTVTGQLLYWSSSDSKWKAIPITSMSYNKDTKQLTLNDILNFKNENNRKIILKPDYETGVQDNTFYIRTPKNFNIYTGGEHSDTENDPGAGGLLQFSINDGKVGIGIIPDNKFVVKLDDKLGDDEVKITDSEGTVLFNVKSDGLSESINLSSEIFNIIGTGINKGIKWHDSDSEWIIDVSTETRDEGVVDGNLNIYGTSNIIVLWRPTKFKENIEVDGSIQIGNDNSTATIENVGKLRYRSSGTNSFCEMCMQTGPSTYSWEIIKTCYWGE